MAPFNNPDRDTVLVSLDKSVHEELKKLAAEAKGTKSDAINLLLKVALYGKPWESH